MSRTYTKTEVEDILRRAARSTAESDAKLEAEMADDSGLSLEDLVHIGSESGLNPEEVVRAAQALGRGDSTSYEKRLLGMDISASHTVILPGRVSDDEWGLLVSDCRKTFYAKGSVLETGSLRDWSNGNLHVTIEPEGEDTLLTFRTHRDAAKSFLAASASTLFITLMMSTRLWSGDMLLGSFFVALAMMATTSVVLALMGTSSTKKWAKTRKRQMESLAARAGARRTEREPSLAPKSPAAAASATEASMSPKLEAPESRIHLDEELETPEEAMATIRSKARDQ